MEPIVEKFGTLWISCFETKHEGNKNVVPITNRVRILEDHATEIEEFLWEEFADSKLNIYQLHLNLIEYFQLINVVNTDACIIFLNRTFEGWWKQQINRVKRAVSNNSCHLINNCSESSCLCLIEPQIVEKAFDLALTKIFLLNSFNKIYKFEDNFQMLHPKIENFLSTAITMNRIKLVNELKLNDLYRIDYENVNSIQILIFKTNNKDNP
ncbi:hypothetical protein BpHYR1_006016 [Brachionus plicatilis]|uniref:Uncharacterized protein n=1 Tax=Brachionus plicatilis TaxID=10195 RepID=A0A3M7R686_BRAPC|nr:hypothetical protein BpHYR1_006016 [Brachionus plicatilis]